MITRRNFGPTYKAGCQNAPPPLDVVDAHEPSNWFPSPRPLGGGEGMRPGPALIYGGSGLPSLGIDPTDSSTWGTRGYSHSPGMIGVPDINMPPLHFGDLATGGRSVSA